MMNHNFVTIKVKLLHELIVICYLLYTPWYTRRWVAERLHWIYWRYINEYVRRQTFNKTWLHGVFHISSKWHLDEVMTHSMSSLLYEGFILCYWKSRRNYMSTTILWYMHKEFGGALPIWWVHPTYLKGVLCHQGLDGGSLSTILILFFLEAMWQLTLKYISINKVHMNTCCDWVHLGVRFVSLSKEH